MNSIGERERRHVRPALIGPSLRMNGEREKRKRDQTGGSDESGRVWQLFFYRGFYTLS